VDFDDPGWDGFLILDVVDERIAYVEVLGTREERLRRRQRSSKLDS
jgi:hypothetical protein